MRPPHAVRCALVSVLSAGTEGDFYALASHAGIAPAAAQATLANLRREGRVVVRHMFAPVGPALRGRPRVVYALAGRNLREAHRAHLQALAEAMAAWR